MDNLFPAPIVDPRFPAGALADHSVAATGALLGAKTDQGSTAACKYYDEIAKNYSCKYHALAANVCRGNDKEVNAWLKLWGVSDKKVDCIRQCLIDSDKASRAGGKCTVPNKPGCISQSCIINYHNACYQKCGASTNAFGGNFFPFDHD